MHRYQSRLPLAMNNHPKPPALLLIGHGSRDADGVREFHRMAERLFAALPERLCVSSFLELTEPSMREGVAQLSRRGAAAITALPVMLMAAGHIKNDIPTELETIQAEHPEVSITLGTELSIHPALLQAARERIEAGEAAFGPDYSRRDSLLLVVGRVLRTRTPIPTWRRSPGCCGRRWVSVGRRRLIARSRRLP